MEATLINDIILESVKSSISINQSRSSDSTLSIKLQSETDASHYISEREVTRN